MLHTAPAELGGKTLGEALLAPTKIYVKPVLKVLEAVSYTHLDVYKRQIFTPSTSITLASGWNLRLAFL